MSQEKWGDAIRRVFAAFTKRDWAAFSATLDSDVEYKPVEENVVYRGQEAVIAYVQRWLEVWETFSAEAEVVEKTWAKDRAFVIIRLRGRGRGSGVEIDMRLFWVADLRGGRLFRISEYSNREEALEAVGLSE